MFKLIKFLLRLITLVVLCGILLVVVNYIVAQSSSKTIFNTTDISLLPNSDGIVVINQTGDFDEFAKSKLEIMVAVKKQKKSEKVYIFGSTGFVKDAEKFLVQSGVKKDDIITNTSELSVYESCYLLKNEYKAKSLIFIDSEFTLKRTLYVADKFDIKSFGVLDGSLSVSDVDRAKEYFTTVKDFFVVNINKYTPKKFR